MEKFNVDVQVIDFEKEIAKIESSFKRSINNINILITCINGTYDM